MQHNIHASTLGAAIVGCPSASLLLPDLWRTALLHDFLDDASRLAMFSTCKAGRDWVLAAGKQLTLHLCLYADASENARRLATVRQYFMQQQQQPQRQRPTVLKFSKHYSADAGQAFMALGSLQFSIGSHVTHLELKAMSLRDIQPRNVFLAATASTFPNLEHLVLHHMNAPLPPPTQLPHLTFLKVSVHPAEEDQRDEVFRSIAALLPQLTTLDLAHTRTVAWADLLRRQTTTATLQTLRVHQPLDDSALSLLLQFAPSIQVLHVGRLQLTSLDHTVMSWVVARLLVDSTSDLLNSVQYLPQQRTTSTSTTTTTSSATSSPLLVIINKGKDQPELKAHPEGIPAAVLHRLSGIQFEGVQEVTLQPCETLPAVDQPTALSFTLQQLSNLHAHLHWQPTVTCKWSWTPAFAAELALCMAAHPQLNTQLAVGTLTDTLITALLPHPQLTEQLAVERIQLEHNHSRHTCHWSRIRVEVPPNAQTLLHMPKPPTDSQLTFQVQQEGAFNTTIDLGLTLQQVETGKADRLAARMSDFVFEGKVCVVLKKPGSVWKTTDQVKILRGCIKVLRAVRVVGSVPWVALEGWQLNEEAVGELSDLPEWSCELVLKPECWDFYSPVFCAQFVSLIPASYTAWRLSGASLEEARLLDLVLGFVRGRQPGRRLVLGVKSDRLRRFIAPYLTQLGLQECLVLEDAQPNWYMH